MQPRISVLTLGVADLERSVAFYRDGLGLATEGIQDADGPLWEAVFNPAFTLEK